MKLWTASQRDGEAFIFLNRNHTSCVSLLLPSTVYVHSCIFKRLNQTSIHPSAIGSSCTRGRGGLESIAANFERYKMTRCFIFMMVCVCVLSLHHCEIMGVKTVVPSDRWPFTHNGIGGLTGPLRCCRLFQMTSLVVVLHQGEKLSVTTLSCPRFQSTYSRYDVENLCMLRFVVSGMTVLRA